MKVALVSPYDYAYPGGVTAHISYLEKNLTQLGHQVKIIAPSSQPEEALACPNVIAVGKPVSIPANGSIARITISLRLSSKVKAILEGERFDIIHLHEPLVPALPITVLRFSNSVNVGTFHSYHHKNRFYFYSRRILKRWFRKLDGKIAVSRPAMELASRYFPGYYNIIPNGIDVSRFSRELPPLREYQDDKLNIVFIGRLEKRKGLKYLLRAYAQIKGVLPNSRLLVVGADGGLKDGYEKWVRKADLQDVVFVGYVSDEELPRYYQAAHVFCAPNTGQESFGIVLLEAMAAGKPIVASNIEGFASVLADGEEGILVPPKDEHALGVTLARLLKDEHLRKRMGETGRAKAEEYDWSRVARRVEAYYNRLLSESRVEVVSS